MRQGVKRPSAGQFGQNKHRDTRNARHPRRRSTAACCGLDTCADWPWGGQAATAGAGQRTRIRLRPLLQHRRRPAAAHQAQRPRLPWPADLPPRPGRTPSLLRCGRRPSAGWSLQWERTPACRQPPLQGGRAWGAGRQCSKHLHELPPSNLLMCASNPPPCAPAGSSRAPFLACSASWLVGMLSGPPWCSRKMRPLTVRRMAGGRLPYAHAPMAPAPP